MGAFIFRRLGAMLLVLFSVVTLTFFMIRLLPGGPFDKERRTTPAIEKALKLKYKLEGPQGRAAGESLAAMLHLGDKGKSVLGETGSLFEQYGNYLWSLVRHGDFGLSTKYLNRTVNEILLQTLPVSLFLGSLAFLIATVAGIWLGTFAAVHHNSWFDVGAMLAALVAISVPSFVTGPLCVLIFALGLGILPVGGWESLASVILPAPVLAAPYVAYIARLMRSSLLEVLGQDFVRTARARGLSENRVVYKHALKVAILPVISYLGPLAANLLTGSLVVEAIFQIPGMGGFFVNAILNRDGFLLGGVVIVYCAMLLVLNLVTDLAYTVLDKRVQLY